MTSLTWTKELGNEATALFTLLGWWKLTLVGLLLIAAIITGRLIRQGVYTLWRLGLDPERRLAPVGTLIQVGLSFALLFSVFHSVVRVAPLASFICVVALSPLLVVLLHRPAKNALAGLTILLRRSFLEGDHIVLEGGQSGVVRQVRLTSTVARGDTGARLVIPNGRLLELVLQVDRRQAGVPLVLKFAVRGPLNHEILSSVKRIGYLSPFRAGGSVVTVRAVDEPAQLEVSLRIPRSSAEDAARRELSAKLERFLKPAEPAEVRGPSDRPAGR